MPMGLPPDDQNFQEFVETAQGLLGGDSISRDWLMEKWAGADANLERAINHLLDTPESQVKRGDSAKKGGDGGGKPKKESKKKKKTDDVDDDWGAGGGDG